jgi:hypothetical protein
MHQHVCFAPKAVVPGGEALTRKGTFVQLSGLLLLPTKCGLPRHPGLDPGSRFFLQTSVSNKSVH